MNQNILIMADSRRASSRYTQKMQRTVDNQKNIITFLLSIIIAFGSMYLLKDSSFTTPQSYVLFLLFFSVLLWVTEAIPPFAVGLFIIGFLLFTLGNPTVNSPESADYIDYTIFINTWSDSVIWLLLGGFFLAEGMKKSKLDVELFRIAVGGFGTKPKYVLLGLMGATAIGSMVMSNTATTAMMIASVSPLLLKLNEGDKFHKALLVGIPAAASIGGMGTIIGSPPNAIAVDAINNSDLFDFNIGFLEWMIVGIPIALVLTLLTWFLLTKIFPAEQQNLDLSFIKPKEELSEEELWEKEDLKSKKNIVLEVLTITILLWLTGKVHGIPPALVSGIPILVFTMLSIITSDDVRSLPWDTLMLVAGGLSLGLAIQKTGLAAYFVTQLADFQMSFWAISLLFGILTVVFSNIMSNTATATILIPIAGLLGTQSPIVVPLIIGLSASCALLFPISTPPNAIAYSTGKLQQKDFRSNGLLIGILGPLLITIWILLIHG